MSKRTAVPMQTPRMAPQRAQVIGSSIHTPDHGQQRRKSGLCHYQVMSQVIFSWCICAEVPGGDSSTAMPKEIESLTTKGRIAIPTNAANTSRTAW
jgi:hypothetical protein